MEWRLAADQFHMEQRRELRFAANQEVSIFALDNPQVRLPAKVTDYSGRGLGLELAHPLEPGTAIRIELDDSLVLGESVYCRQTGTGWFAGIEVDQTLCGLTELARMVAALEESPASVADRRV